MKMKKKTSLKLPTSVKKLKWYTLEEVFGKDLKSDEFQRGYQEESARIALAYKIRQTRMKKHLTQAVVAKKASMPQSVIARLESGDHGVSLDTLSRVAHALGKKVALV